MAGSRAGAWGRWSSERCAACAVNGRWLNNEMWVYKGKELWMQLVWCGCGYVGVRTCVFAGKMTGVMEGCGGKEG